MSLNKYPCIFSRQMEATVSINLIIFLQRAGKIFTINLLLFFFFFCAWDVYFVLFSDTAL